MRNFPTICNPSQKLSSFRSVGTIAERLFVFDDDFAFELVVEIGPVQDVPRSEARTLLHELGDVTGGEDGVPDMDVRHHPHERLGGDESSSVTALVLSQSDDGLPVDR